MGTRTVVVVRLVVEGDGPAEELAAAAVAALGDRTWAKVPLGATDEGEEVFLVGAERLSPFDDEGPVEEATTWCL